MGKVNVYVAPVRDEVEDRTKNFHRWIDKPIKLADDKGGECAHKECNGDVVFGFGSIKRSEERGEVRFTRCQECGQRYYAVTKNAEQVREENAKQRELRAATSNPTA